jgi:hypothetical protein
VLAVIVRMTVSGPSTVGSSIGVMVTVAELCWRNRDTEADVQ